MVGWGEQLQDVTFWLSCLKKKVSCQISNWQLINESLQLYYLFYSTAECFVQTGIQDQQEKRGEKREIFAFWLVHLTSNINQDPTSTQSAVDFSAQSLLWSVYLLCRQAERCFISVCSHTLFDWLPWHTHCSWICTVSHSTNHYQHISLSFASASHYIISLMLPKQQQQQQHSSVVLAVTTLSPSYKC